MHAFWGLSTLIQFLEGCESFRMESGVKKTLLLSLPRSVSDVKVLLKCGDPVSGFHTKIISTDVLSRRFS
jgi:hypothetical protein